MCNSAVTVGPVVCVFCEEEITQEISENFYRDPVQTYKQFTCPHCKKVLDVEVIPVPHFHLSMPVGRVVQTDRKGVYCKYCEFLVEYGDMKPWRKDDDTVEMLCPGCDSVLVEGE